eukprot:386599-Pyramimonas_sp.AAC.1
MSSYSPPSVRSAILGPLPGRRQTVPRGELYGLLLAITYSTGPLIYVTDNSAVADGWYAGLYLEPSGDNMGIWDMIRKQLRDQDRDTSQIVVLQ